MSDQPPNDRLPAGIEEALFQRLLQRMIEAGQGLASGDVSDAAETVASGVCNAAKVTDTVAVQTAALIAEATENAAEYVQKHGIESLSALDLMYHPETSGPLTVAAAQRIVENRRNKEEPIAQVLFRVPEHLRDDIKRLALDEKRQMDELLTEAVLDLLLKHARMPKAFQKLSEP